MEFVERDNQGRKQMLLANNVSELREHLWEYSSEDVN